MAEYCQAVTLVLSDGRRVTFMGQHQIEEPTTVVEIIVGPAIPLPEGMVWDTLSGTEPQEGMKE